MDAGALPHRVTIEEQSEVSDGHDGLITTWSVTHARVPARVNPLVGRDLEKARQIDPRITHEVTLRYWQDYRTDLDGGRSRLIYHDRTDREFEIIGGPIDVGEMHDELRQTCREAA